MKNGQDMKHGQDTKQGQDTKFVQAIQGSDATQDDALSNSPEEDIIPLAVAVTPHHTSQSTDALPPRADAPIVVELSSSPAAARAPFATVGPDEREDLSWIVRITALLSGLALLALLITARNLNPSPSGFGTHQQLGLPPCTAVLLLDKPCPACGMTTSWAHTMRGNLAEAAGANTGGMLLALIALAFLPASCYFFLYGKATRGQWFSLALAICLITALSVALVQWVYRLVT